jgi:hypothetical protein
LTFFTPQRFAIKLSPGTYQGAISIGDNQRMEIHGDNADLTRGEVGPILQARGSATLTVLGLRIHDAFGVPEGIGVYCTEANGNMPTVVLHRVTVDRNTFHGIEANRCELHVERSVIDNNPSGGIVVVGGKFELTNNLIIRNGGSSNALGGVYLDTIEAAGNILDFNTIADNSAIQSIPAAGVTCTGSLGTMIFSNNIVFSNLKLPGQRDVQGVCVWRYSNIEGGAPGIGNLDAAPLFARLGADPDFHITPESPCVDAADPAASLDVDIDGDARPRGAARDMGADEAPWAQ